jgi:hypothetical protein|tara:strand:- start:481 stop:609 length:129 start_codon:yes stop_codon:yes gene_type:complete
MSTLDHEGILEGIYADICEEFPDMPDQDKHNLTLQRFEDLCQ